MFILAIFSIQVSDLRWSWEIKVYAHVQHCQCTSWWNYSRSPAIPHGEIILEVQPSIDFCGPFKRMVTFRKRSRSTLTESEESSSDSFSAGDSRSSQKRQYKQAYRPKWEEQSELWGWLSRSWTKSGMAKLCNCNLEADLKRHITTKKHSDNAKLISRQRTLDSLTSITLDSKVKIIIYR